MNKPLVLDIESGPADTNKLLEFMPEFVPPGNYRDPEKIAQNLNEQRERWTQDCALSALTGRILAVGMLHEQVSILTDNESSIVDSALQTVAFKLREGGLVVGFYIRTFDIPFLIRRAWALGVRVPLGLREGRFLHSSIVDLAELWACGSRDPRDRVSLANLAKHLSIGIKSGSGADFAELWATNRDQALEYLRNDLKLTRKAYDVMMGL